MMILAVGNALIHIQNYKYMGHSLKGKTLVVELTKETSRVNFETSAQHTTSAL